LSSGISTSTAARRQSPACVEGQGVSTFAVCKNKARFVSGSEKRHERRNALRVLQCAVNVGKQVIPQTYAKFIFGSNNDRIRKLSCVMFRATSSRVLVLCGYELFLGEEMLVRFERRWEFVERRERRKREDRRCGKTS